MPDLVYLGMIAFVGGLVQGMTGFGVMLVALPLMSLVIDIKTAIPLIIVLGMVINAILVIQLVDHFEKKKWLPLLMASFPGIPVGMYLQLSVSARPLEILVGVVLLLTTATTWVYHQPKKELKSVWAGVSGFFSGCLAGSIGASGPPVIVYTACQPWTKKEVKSTLVAFFMINGIGVFALYCLFGLYTTRILQLFGYCLVPLVIGVFAGSFLYGRVNDTGYRHAVHILLLVLGIMMLVKG